jgi:hypothetical protein
MACQFYIVSTPNRLAYHGTLLCWALTWLEEANFRGVLAATGDFETKHCSRVLAANYDPARRLSCSTPVGQATVRCRARRNQHPHFHLRKDAGPSRACTVGQCKILPTSILGGAYELLDEYRNSRRTLSRGRNVSMSKSIPWQSVQ